MGQRPPRNLDDEAAPQMQGLIKACFVALVAGLLIGVIGAYFREGLVLMADWHTQAVVWAKQWPALGWAIPVALGVITAGVARLLVRMEPLAAGSGVQHVEAVMHGQAKVAPIWVVPIKFFGGIIGIGMGLALGREGPTVQMGATIGGFIGRCVRCAKEVIRDLQAALGGAGLAVAFNAPMGGAMFVFEEVAHAFRLRLTLLTMLSTGAAIAMSRLILGNHPDFVVAEQADPEAWMLVVYGVFGLLVGLLGVVYNKLTVAGLRGMDKLRGIPPELRAGIVGIVVGIIAWFSPELVGGGDPASQQILSGLLPLGSVAIILVVRWFLGPLSYSVGTPGGLFAPLLLVGAALGAVFAMLYNHMAPDAYALPAVALAVVGMTAFFTGVVRAPFTGILLIAEMTYAYTLFLPMVIACFAAMLSASLVRGAPIYDTLRARMLATLPSKYKDSP